MSSNLVVLFFRELGHGGSAGLPGRGCKRPPLFWIEFL
jgi:hypothetical protein